MATRRASLFDRSRVVGAAKLILPLVALALLSMVFLLAETVDPSRALDSAEIDVEDRARDPRLSGARFAGVTDDGAALRITTGAARSDPAATLRFQVEDFALWLDGPDDGHLIARSDAGYIDRGRGAFEMSGDIRISATPGYELAASRIEGLLDRTEVEVAGPVTGEGPPGRIQAGSLSVSAVPAAEGGGLANRLVFRQGVRLIYDPPD